MPRLLVALALLAFACSTDPVSITKLPDAGTSADGGGAADGGETPDAGDPRCAGTSLDEMGTCRNAAGNAAPVDCCAPYDCDATQVTCKVMTPGCGPSERPSVVGSCWGPCVPATLCAPPPPAELLCVNTGGKWLTDTCGNWQCGNAPACAAIIPGCNCGPEKIFDETRGCIASDSCLAGYGETCGGHAINPRRCGPGMTCVMGDDGAVDAPGTCQPDPAYSCEDGAPCGRGLACCYPCGIPGCQHACVVPDASGSCPAVP